MRTHFSGIVATLMLASLGFSQSQDTLKKHTHIPVSAAPGPVTNAEAAATFGRVAGLFRTILHVSIPPHGRVSSPDAPITRSDVIEELTRYYKYAVPAFTITLKSVKVDYPRLRLDKPALRSDLVLLIEKGCVSKYGVLATGSVKTIGVHDFGDTVGFFLARIAEMTHTPSTKWTPYLHGDQA